MKHRAAVDAELSVLKSTARLAEGRDRQVLENARYNLFMAFEQKDPGKARRWCRATRMALDVVGEDLNEDVHAAALEAIDIIEEAIEDGRQP